MCLVYQLSIILKGSSEDEGFAPKGLKLRKKEVIQQNNALRQDYIEKMIIELEILSTQIANLAEDPTKYNYFSLQNIYLIKPVLDRLQLLSEDKLSLFSDTDFRSKILDTINEINSVIDEIKSKEENPLKTFTDHNAIKDKIVDEYNTLKLKLLDLGIFLDDNNIPSYFDDSQMTKPGCIKQLSEVSNMIQIFNNRINNSQDQLDRINSDIKDKRSFLAVKLLNTQTKIKELLRSLKNE